MWDLPGPGIEPVSPALAGRFLSTAPPRKPRFLSPKSQEVPDFDQSWRQPHTLPGDEMIQHPPEMLDLELDATSGLQLVSCGRGVSICMWKGEGTESLVFRRENLDSSLKLLRNI